MATEFATQATRRKLEASDLRGPGVVWKKVFQKNDGGAYQRGPRNTRLENPYTVQVST